MKGLFGAAAAAAMLLAAGPAAADSFPTAVLRGLDKVSGQYRDFNAPVGRVSKFETLAITVRACHKAPPEEPPATWAYLEVVDSPLRTAEGEAEQVKVMSGWTLASSPGLNGLEHPVYDIWVIDCKA